jgi:hypoxanthine phosphoribosyltransferase
MSTVIQILDLSFKPYISATQIEEANVKMAAKINVDYKDKNPLFICILKGSFIFASDLFKKITIPAEIEFIRLKSYDGTQSTEHIQTLIGLSANIIDRNIIILEDIVDTGNTLESLLNDLKKEKCQSIGLASLIFKKDAFKKDFKIDYLGFEIENKFIVGYGLDYNEYGRNLPEIYQIV